MITSFIWQDIHSITYLDALVNKLFIILFGLDKKIRIRMANAVNESELQIIQSRIKFADKIA
jgi:hypothetical protein